MCEVGEGAGKIRKEMKFSSSETELPRLLSKGKKRNKGNTVDCGDMCAAQSQLP